MKTRLVKADSAAVNEAASLLREGQVVAFPTETVYGLGADGLNGDAVARIFAVKNRPADNPLILHIASRRDLDALVTRIPPAAEAAMVEFWPGPLTLVMEKTDAVPPIVTAGLPTVAVRMPSHPVARRLIAVAGRPLAAPSANRSGRPSPTRAGDVLDDMDGRIPLILDGGSCAVGVESTVLDVTGPTPRILRPGGVTREMLWRTLGPVDEAPSVMRPLDEGEAAPSPGMRHRHYAPRVPLTIVEGGAPALFLRYDQAETRGKTPVLLCTAQTARDAGSRRCVVMGDRDDADTIAESLFSALRELDRVGADIAFAEAVEPAGVGLAVMNRLLRAAQFRVEGRNTR
ncbi:MAG: threonylcarbamoyl-AMP synthase [Clostridiales bacterium]|nr:threonylcarbamoyl-AMP synthase [Clostridiales bacterium]